MKPTIFQLNNGHCHLLCVCARVCMHACVLLELQPRGSHTLGEYLLLCYTSSPTDWNWKLLREIWNVHLGVSQPPSGPRCRRMAVGFAYGSFALDFTWVGLIGGGGALRFFGVPLLSELILETWSCWKLSQSTEWRWVSYVSKVGVSSCSKHENNLLAVTHS